MITNPQDELADVLAARFIASLRLINMGDGEIVAALLKAAFQVTKYSLEVDSAYLANVMENGAVILRAEPESTTVN